jgi:hypothetical protein
VATDPKSPRQFGLNLIKTNLRMPKQHKGMKD